MEAAKYIKDAQELTALSPLRKKKGMPSVSFSQEQLTKIDMDLKLLADKCRVPLKIVLMGEVKAGKSALINALAGGEIAPTNVTETTAAIMIMKYGEKEEAQILFTNGNSINGTASEIYDELNRHHGNQDYFKKVDYVEVCLPLPNLRSLHIVDTPGLMSVTDANGKRTEKFFQQSDVVLWVFNGHYLGQSDVNEEIEKLSDMGKPVIGIINRIDEISEDRKVLVRYVNREMGIYLNHVFPLSAKQAYDGVLARNEALKKESGFTDLMDYLENSIERHADAVLNESIISSAKALLGEEILIHKEVLADIETKKLLVQRTVEKMNQQSQHIKMNQESRIKYWFRTEFLSKKESELQARVNNLSILTLGSGTEELKRIIQTELSENSIRKEIDQFMQNLDSDLKNDWANSFKTIQKEVSGEFKNYVMNYNAQAKILLNSLPNQGSDAMDGAGQGALAGSMFGGVLAGYAAWIGPAAAQISIFSALSAFVPPMLIAGTIAGAATRLFKQRSVKSRYSQLISEQIDTIRNDVSNNLEPKVILAINSTCDTMVEQCREQLSAQHFPNSSPEQVQSIQKVLKGYIESAEKVREENQ